MSDEKIINYPLEIPFKDFMPGQVIQSGQFNDDMAEIEEKVNEVVEKHNTLTNETDNHVSNKENPHEVTAHQVGTYSEEEINAYLEDIRNGGLYDKSIENRVLDDECIETRNIKNASITSIKVDSNFGSQINISKNMDITDRYTKKEVDDLLTQKVGEGTYSKEELNQMFEDVQAGQIVDGTIDVSKLKDNVGKNLDISANPSILDRYTKAEVNVLIQENGLPRDWGGLEEITQKQHYGQLPVADVMTADEFVAPSTPVLDIDVKEVVEARNGYNSLSARLDNIESNANGFNTSNKLGVDVTTLGVSAGSYANPYTNTTILQDYINKNDSVVLYFPPGNYMINSLNFGTDKNITFRGVSSSFASSVNKSVSNPRIIDTYSRILFFTDEYSDYFITHNNCTIIFDKISFVNGFVDETNTINLHKNKCLVKTSANNIKGKIFTTECSYIGFKNVFGDIDILSKNSDVLQTCVMAHRCRFTENIVALSQLVDGRITDCSFNKNDYALYMKNGGGFTTFSNNRVEWNRKHGIYILGSHDMTITGNEFDRNSFAGLYVDGLTGGNITSNTFRRNGADDTLDREDYENNLHFVVKNCTNVNVTNSLTVAKSTLDTSSGGSTRPTNCSKFSNNSKCIFKDNNLTGCTKGDKNNANLIENNTNCIVNDNIQI